MTKVIKKNGTLENWNKNKIIKAVTIASERANTKLTQEQFDKLLNLVEMVLTPLEQISVLELHNVVMSCLYEVDHRVYTEYKAYRNYKERFTKSFANTYEMASKIVMIGDNENANKDSTLNSTKQALIAEGIMKELMRNFELKPEWVQAHDEGWIYIHDMSQRFLRQKNCCLFNIGNVLRDGFNLCGVKYKEPGGVQSAFNIAGDITLSASAQQLGGFTLAQVDEVFEYYAEKTYSKSKQYYLTITHDEQTAHELAYNLTVREIEQGYQAFETKINTISNSLGQTPFISITFGLSKTYWGRFIQKTILKQRQDGLGETKSTAVFPKLILFVKDELNMNVNSPNYDIYKLAIQCSSKRLYPDYLSLNNGYLGEVYSESGEAISPMGCRAFLSKFYNPLDGKLIFNGRANIGAITLNLPKIGIESKGDINKFYEIVDKYSDMIFKIHLDYYDKLSRQKGSTNPLFYCEGGCWKTVGYDESIAPCLEGFTASLGYIGLEETCQAMFGSGLVDNQEFCKQVVTHLKDLTETYKKKHAKLYALYATPAEGLIGKVQKSNLDNYGIIKNVTDRLYCTNSHHVPVWVDISATDKQDIEKQMFDIATGGRIMYNEFPNDMDLKALEQLITNAMNNGLYYGVNINSCTCQDCGTQGDFQICPSCGSQNIIEVNRCCGYLSYSKINGKNRYNEAKYAEIQERVDHI